MQQVRQEILVVELGGRCFGFPVASIRELVRAVAIVPLPLAPSTVEGMINLRGAIVPVLNLRARLGLPAKVVQPSDHLIVGQVWGRLVALRVDRALELTSGGAAGARGEALSPGRENEARVATFNEGLAPILDLRTLLTEAESTALDPFFPKTGTVREEAGCP